MSMSIMMALAMAQSAGSITVNVGNVRNASGRVVVGVCPQQRFLANRCAIRTTARARAGTTTVTIPNVPAGQYSVQAFHDENANGDADRDLIGIPNEGVGFSRDALTGFRPPIWADAVIVHQGNAKTIGFRLRYFKGEKGPNPPR